MAKRRKAKLEKVAEKITGKGPRANPKTKSDAPGAAPGIGHNSQEQRELFLRHRMAWNQWKAKRATVDEIERDVKVALKGDGFSVKQFQIADALSTLKGEERISGEVRDRLQVALWMGHPMGAQLDMFEQPDRTPITDRAFDEGQQASMENRAARPDYAPDTEAYRSYMAGFHDHQRELAGGIKRGRVQSGHVQSAHQLNDEISTS